MKGILHLFKEKKGEYASALLALVYLACRGIVILTIDSVNCLLGKKKEDLTLKDAEISLVLTTGILLCLIFASQTWNSLGWAVIVLGNLRIWQILSLNILTLLFNFSPTGSSESQFHKARWHFVALGFSLVDAVLVFAFMFQFFDHRMRILNEQFSHFLDYFYFALVTMATVGYRDVHPVTSFGKGLACYEIGVSLMMIAFF